MIEYSEDFNPAKDFLGDMNKNNDESFSCYFEKEIEFRYDKGHPSQDLMFKINFKIKQSDRYFADFDPIAEELWTYYNRYANNLKAQDAKQIVATVFSSFMMLGGHETNSGNL